jgi:Zn-dependent protease
VIALAPIDWTAAIVLFVVLIISLTTHEAAHALVAKLAGDDTAHRGGQVTLNPIPHMQREPVGMLVLPLLSIYFSGASGCIGFASAPIDAVWAHHHPKRAAIVSAAGPLANVVLAAIAFAVLWFVGRPDSGEGEAVRRIAGTFLRLNLLLALFNVFPVPPLDGAGVLAGLLQPARRLYDGIARIPGLGIVLLLLVALRVMPAVFWPVFDAVNRLLPYPA